MDKQCTKCGDTKPLAEFKRKLTKAQTKARGYAGNFHVEIESKLCKDCQPRVRKVGELSAREIRARMESGDIRLHVGEDLLKKNERNLRHLRRKVAAERWRNKRMPTWAAMLDSLHVELVKSRQQIKHWGNKGHDVTVLHEYVQLLVKLRSDFNFKGKRLGEKPDHEQWYQYVNDEDRRRFTEAWRGFCEDIPHNSLLKMRIPVLMSAWLDSSMDNTNHKPPPIGSSEALDRLALISVEKRVEKQAKAAPMDEQQIQASTDALMRELGIR